MSLNLDEMACTSYHPSKSPFLTVILSLAGTKNSIVLPVAEAAETEGETIYGNPVLSDFSCLQIFVRSTADK